MFSRCLSFSAIAAAAILASPAAAAAQSYLRVCSDPNNLPFSNKAGEGFENRIAEILADELDAELSYVWWAQRRGFLRNTLNAGKCDLVIGAPMGQEMLRTFSPYYKSSYVFVQPAGETPIASYDDPRLNRMKIGVQIVGDDGANTPPVHELAERGLAENIRGYTVYGDYSKPNPTATIVEAVAEGEVDTAIVWGPIAGYFAQRQPTALQLTPVSATEFLPVSFEIGFGVRKAEAEFAETIENAANARDGDISAVLNEFGVPEVETKTETGALQ